MSWDYNFNTNFSEPQPVASFNKPSLDFLGNSNNNTAIFDNKSGSISSTSSTDSISRSGTMYTMSSGSNSQQTEINHFNDMDQTKLLPTNLWGEVKKPVNTAQEAQFLQSQLSLDNTWGNIDQNEQTSIFDSRGTTGPNSNYTASTTPITSNSPPIPLMNSIPNANLNMNAFNTNVAANAASAQVAANVQALLSNYQQQQQYMEQLQHQQQWLQNPLFLQQQAQVVSQQLQQLQAQLQAQQQQIEATNQALLAKKQESQPLTQENLTKLEGDDLLENSGQSTVPTSVTNLKSTAEGSNTSDDAKVNTELYKTELCSTFLRTGNCPYGSKCQFAHGEHELNHVDRGSKWRSKACANWSKTGTCRYGSRCCFRHGN